MSLAPALQRISSTVSSLPRLPVKGLAELLDRGGVVGGEFPTPRSVVDRIRAAAAEGDYAVPLLVREIRTEPLLAARLIAVANSSVYLRGKAVESIEHALITVGPKRILGLVDELGAIESYDRFFAGRAVSLGAWQEQLLVGLLAGEIFTVLESELPQTRDWATICAHLYMLAPTLLGYYRPHLYSALKLDAVADDTPFAKGFEKVVGRTLTLSAVTLAKQLSVPEDMLRVLLALDRPLWNNREWRSEKDKPWALVASAVSLALAIVNELSRGVGTKALEQLIKEHAQKIGVKRSQVEGLMGALPAMLADECAVRAVPSLSLPYFLEGYQRDHTAHDAKAARRSVTGRFPPYLTELKVCLKLTAGEGEYTRLPQAVLSTVEGLLRGLAFDRVFLFQITSNGKSLVPVFATGVQSPEQAFITSRVDGPGVESLAVATGKACFSGRALFEDGWPFVAFPIIQGGKVEGAFYADRINRPGTIELTHQEQMACIALAELWYDVSRGFQ
jgi:hypothetical protein